MKEYFAPHKNTIHSLYFKHNPQSTAFTFWWGVAYREEKKHVSLWLRLHEAYHHIRMKNKGCFAQGVVALFYAVTIRNHDDRPNEIRANRFADEYYDIFVRTGVNADEYLKSLIEFNVKK